MKTAPVYQWIDFSSEESSGQITSYFWDFWDWEVSTEANPTHAFEVAWDYSVTLKVSYQNNNTLTDSMDIKITE